MNGNEAYRIFRAMKAHFTSDYDFVKYGGKVKGNPRVPDQHRYLFEKLGEIYPTKNKLIGALLSNFIIDSSLWVDQIVNDAGQDTYDTWKSRIGALPYYFENDLDLILDKADGNFKAVFKCENSDHPLILKLMLSGRICIETFVVLDIMTGFVKRIDKKIADDPVWEIESEKMRNYKPFLKVDIDRYKNILKNKLSERTVHD